MNINVYAMCMLMLVMKNLKRRHTCIVCSFLVHRVLPYNSHTTSTLGSRCLRIMHTNTDWVISKFILDDSLTTTVVPKGLSSFGRNTLWLNITSFNLTCKWISAHICKLLDLSILIEVLYWVWYCVAFARGEVSDYWVFYWWMCGLHSYASR